MHDFYVENSEHRERRKFRTRQFSNTNFEIYADYYTPIKFALIHR